MCAQLLINNVTLLKYSIIINEIYTTSCATISIPFITKELPKQSANRLCVIKFFYNLLYVCRKILIFNFKYPFSVMIKH